MPRKAHNVSRQRTRGNAITINGLLTWRARLLRRLRKREGDTASIEADIQAIDRVLVNVIGFTGDIETLTRDFRREALFKRGELQRLVMAVLRDANEPLTTRQITERVMDRKGASMTPGRDSKQRIHRVRAVCKRLDAQAMLNDDGLQSWAMDNAT
ncbi:MAG: hypothetical protein JJ969_15720 [Rhizobiaceae bacterium]|nr:hypothetical protein [Rhizobiaceae bacterium]